MQREGYPLLYDINSPEDLRNLSKEQLPQICNEVRCFLLECVSRSSGHLASGLGVVELTVALHYVYHTPFDNLIWDVGHQAYPHKILTGRRDKMTTIRQKDGLHPFPWRKESEYDVLSVGHSSTSISAGLGMAIAAEKEQRGRRTVCVIGDGAITAGMAFEAMNHAGHLKNDLLVVLNDNNMSISKNVGALSNNLAQILSGKLYSSVREKGKQVFSNVPPLKMLFKKTEEQLKSFVSSPGALFEELGFNYIGPVDGHDIDALVHTLQNMRELKGPQFLHVVTTKGKGYQPAEQDPIRWHGVPKFDPKTGTLSSNNNVLPTYSTIFGDWLCEEAKQDPALMAITPAMCEGSGMTQFAKCHPDRFFDVAIAEQHAVTLASGLAIGGYKPVVAIYSTFLQRAYDQVIHDVALQDLPILFAIDRAGIVGADGATHQGAYDLSFLRCIPNLIIMTPSDENECRQMLHTGLNCGSPAAVRYPRGNGLGTALTPLEMMPIGKGKICRQGTRIAILNFGTRLQDVMHIAETLNASVADMRFVKPLDHELITQLAKTHDYLVTVEENTIAGGAGSAVNEFIIATAITIKLLNIGYPDQFIPQGEQQEILTEMGLDAAGMLQQIKTHFDITDVK